MNQTKRGGRKITTRERTVSESMKESHQVTITSELIDEIHKTIEEVVDNTVYRCGQCKNILDSTWFCEVCNYQHNIVTSTRY